MKRPSFQFYPADWRNNAKLRRCSWEARGAWLEVMCLLHDSEEYGVLRWPLKEIAQAIGAPVRLIRELADKGVMKGCDAGFCDPYIYTPRSGRKDGEPVVLVDSVEGPIWYSTRMVKDEHVRSHAGGATRFTGNEAQPGRRLKPAELTDREWLRVRVLEKTAGTCYHCRCDLGDTWEIDHLMPRSRGGRHAFANLVPSCVTCNQDKSDTLPEDFSALRASPIDSPSRRQGDGSTSTSTSTTSPSLRSGESAPKRATRAKRTEITLQVYLDLCKAEGKKPIPPDHSIRDYCRDAGITDEMIQVAWLVFRDKYTTGEQARKGYKDWPGHFANTIKNRWQNLWFVNTEGAAEWTATGQQARRVVETRAKPRQEQPHEHA